jgi:hypothetical protein
LGLGVAADGGVKEGSAAGAEYKDAFGGHGNRVEG